MTIIPPSAEDLLSHLRAQVDELTRQLAVAGVDSSDALALKQRIFLLHRSVALHAQVIDALQHDVKALVDGWKVKFVPAAPATPAVVAPPAVGAPVSPVETPGAVTALEVSFPSADPLLEDEAAVSTAAVVSTPAMVTPTPRSAPQVRSAFGTPVQGQPRVIDELNASTFVERGWSRIATGDYPAAEESLEKALALNPGDAQAETLLGWAQMSQGRFDAALALFDHVLDRIPDHALATINVAFVHLRRRQFDQAIALLTRAIALDTDRKATLYAHFYLGLVYFEQQQYAEAIGALLRAIELGPNLIEARFELGRVYWFAERTDDAIATWRKAADVNKFNPWSARCREMLVTIADGGAPSRVA
ncbi:MAG: tetratricopeptide repeat protein [Gemmatimonadaceae bacterium]|nr:tetratricopeptide repeat protein [Gemmatimonadaceae bacterium]